ncbi:NADP-dependent oxidoreductase [Streptomyces albiaxialis]|uniref:NADP-dependent oxidoreductase n=1 Tax=Streptomyces albiaxialis TaxID=329523 RepID=A0ABN2VUR4_9ACTN
MPSNARMTEPRTVKAIAFDRHGGPDVLAPAAVEVPAPGPGQIRIAVRTAGVNPLDHKIRRDEVREHFVVALPHVPGIEAAGVVTATGPGVTDLAAGDEVFGRTVTGSYAEEALAEARHVARRPATLGWAEAAAVPTAAETAHRCLRELGMREGETLLLHAAAGGVGVLAVQFAVARGIRVIGTASEANHGLLRELGAEPVAYGEGLAARVRALAPEGVHAALDGAQRGGSLALSVELTGGTERVLAIAEYGDAVRHGVRFSGGSDLDLMPPALAEALALHRAGTLRLPVHRLHPLADAALAHEESERGHARGKRVLVIH